MFVRRFVSTSRSQHRFKRSYTESNNIYYKVLTGEEFNRKFIIPGKLIISRPFSIKRDKFKNKHLFIGDKEIFVQDLPPMEFSLAKNVITTDGIVQLMCIPNDATIVFREDRYQDEYYTDKILEDKVVQCGKVDDFLNSIFRQMKYQKKNNNGIDH
jgi:hypothetical protein